MPQDVEARVGEMVVELEEIKEMKPNQEKEDGGVAYDIAKPV